jgi:hypothetical protein
VKALVDFAMAPNQKCSHFEQEGSRLRLRFSSWPKSVFPVLSVFEESVEGRP